MVMVLPVGRCVTLVVVGVLALGPAQAVKLRTTKKHNAGPLYEQRETHTTKPHSHDHLRPSLQKKAPSGVN